MSADIKPLPLDDVMTSAFLNLTKIQYLGMKAFKTWLPVMDFKLEMFSFKVNYHDPFLQNTNKVFIKPVPFYLLMSQLMHIQSEILFITFK
jgi:hypothetical protein